MKRLILLVFIGTFLIINVAPSIIHYPINLLRLFDSNKLNDAKKETQEVCQSQQCKKIARIILKSMNKSVDPCDDFYEYACGKFSKNFPIPYGLTSWSLWNILILKIDAIIKNIVNTEIKNDDILAVKIAKRWYKSCINTDAMDKRGLGPLITTLSHMGGWPMIMEPNEWNEQEYNWQKVDDHYMRLTGHNTFYRVHVEEVVNNETTMGVHVSIVTLYVGIFCYIFT